MPLSLRLSSLGLSMALLAPAVPVIAQTTPTTSPKVIKSTEQVRGRLNAPITLVEYADFECPFCQKHHPIMKRIIRKYRGKVSWMYRHYPLSQFHPNAQSAAEASECVAYLGGRNAFWSFADALYSKKGFTPKDYAPMAQAIGVDGKALQQCMQSKLFTKKVTDQHQGGKNAGVEGTPTIFIVNRKTKTQEKVVGAEPLEIYTAIIDRMLAELNPKPAGTGSLLGTGSTLSASSASSSVISSSSSSARPAFRAGRRIATGSTLPVSPRARAAASSASAQQMGSGSMTQIRDLSGTGSTY